MKKIGLLVILGILFIGQMQGQKYRFEYDIDFHLLGQSDQRLYLRDGYIITESGKKFNLGDDFNFTREKHLINRVGDIEIEVKDGWIKKFGYNTARQHRSKWGEWDNKCSQDIANDIGSCLSPSTSIDWGCVFGRGVDVNKLSYYPILDIKSTYINTQGQIKTSTFLPEDDKLKVEATSGFPSSVYNWQYTTKQDSIYIAGRWIYYPTGWMNVPSQFNNNHILSISGKDLLGSNVKDMYNKNIYFRMNHACNKYTQTLTFQILPSAPHIVSVDYILESCYESGNAQLILKFDRPLFPKENLYYSQRDSISGIYNAKDFPISIDPITLESNFITGLVAGKYELGLRGTYRYGATDADTIPTYVEGENHYYTINIPKRQKVTYKVFQDSVRCHEGRDGRIKIKAEGGTGSYYAELYEQGKRGTLFRIPVSFTDSIYYFTDLPKGDYEVYLEDTNGCKPQGSDLIYQPISVEEPIGPLHIFDDDYHEPKAFGYSDGEAWAFIDGGSGAYSIVWKDSVSGTVLKTETLIRSDSVSSVKTILPNIPKGKYTIEVYDQNWNPAYLPDPSKDYNYCGCQASKTIDVDQPPKLLVEIKEYHYVTCNGDNDGELIAKVTGGRPHLLPKKPYKYEWCRIAADSTTVLETYPSVNDSILSNLYSGHYMICVTDSNFIQATSRIFHLVQPDPLVVSTNIRQHLLCDGYKIGEIEAVVTGGTPPYEYFWETGDTTRIVTGLGKGIYSVFVRDARYKDNPRHYCSMEAFGEITSPNGMNITSTIKEPTCNTYADGEIILAVTGGVMPYTFLWSDGATTQNRTGLPEGDYSVVITDANGCRLADEYSLYEPEPLTVNIGGDITLCKGRSVTLNGSIGQHSITYLWTKDGSILSTDSIYTISTSGKYRLMVTNQDGCSAYDEITVRQSNDELTADFVVATEIPNNKKVYAVNITNMSYDRIEWIMPDEATIAEQTEHQIYFSIPYNGYYSIGMIGYKGACQDILYKTIEVKDARDIDDYQEVEPFIKKFIVYPNPNDGNFSAEIELCEQMNYTLYLYDGTGNLIETKNIRNTKGTTTRFSATGKGAGVYLLRFVSQKMNSTFKVIIK